MVKNLRMTKELSKYTSTKFQENAECLILGSSHISRLNNIENMSKVAISGGKLQHFQKYIDLNCDIIGQFKYIIIMDAGNEIKPNNMLNVLPQYELTIDNLHQKFPKLKIITTDQIPRRLQGFNKLAQVINKKILKRNINHFHLTIFNEFTRRIARPSRAKLIKEKYFNLDGIHLNEEGQQHLSAIIQNIDFEKLRNFRFHPMTFMTRVE